MDFGDLSKALHILDSDAAVPLVKRALRLKPDQILVNEDLLSCGPAPATNDMEMWRTTREKFLRELYVWWPEFSFEEYSNNGLLMNVARLNQVSTIAVWAARGIAEQLLLAWVVFLFDRLELDISKLRVIQFKNPRRNILSTGELSPDAIRSAHPIGQRLNPQGVAELRRVWRVYTSSDPGDLVNYVTEESRMPSLHHAVSRLVYRYPEMNSGLSIWDEQLLRFTKEQGPSAGRVVAFSFGDFESPDIVGDWYLFHRLLALGNNDMTAPLVSVSGSRQKMHDCSVTITPFGEKVLEGHANHVEVNGIDDWIGGVHLTSERPVTFREGDTLILPR